MAVLSLDDLFPKGAHKGEQVEDVLQDNPGYLVWCVEYDVFDFDQEVMDLLVKKRLI